MENVYFDFYFGDDNKLEVEAEVTLGKPARINCLPEDAEPAEDDTVEITDVWMVDGDGGRVEFFPGNVLFRPFAKTEPKCLEDALIEAAIEKVHEG
jgi:hypothetical protein